MPLSLRGLQTCQVCFICLGPADPRPQVDARLQHAVGTNSAEHTLRIGRRPKIRLNNDNAYRLAYLVYDSISAHSEPGVL